MKHPIANASIVCIGLLALAGCKGSQQGPQQPPPASVGVITVHPQTAELNKELVGRLSAYRNADVLARVSGVLLKRVYTEGSDVKQGQLMFRIDSAPYKAALDSALANLASAKATYANAHVAADRDRALVGKGYVSQSQLDNDEATERSSAANVKQVETTVQNARINLGYTNITSPIDGRSGEQQVTEGAVVGNGTSDTGASSTVLTTVQQLDPLYVNFSMSATDLGSLQSAQSKGQIALTEQNKTTIQVTLPDGSPYDQQGTLDFSAPTVNATTGSVNLRAVLPNSQHQLLPGTYVTFTINLGHHNNVFLLPQLALQRDVAGAYAMVVDKDGKAQRKNVTADNSQNNQWIVTSGLADGDQIIVSGLQSAQPGAPVKASPWQPDAAASGNKPAQPQPAAKS